jgi:parvulin-like peptidyl-prolyl isomerase
MQRHLLPALLLGLAVLGCRAPDRDPAILQLGDEKVRKSEFDAYVTGLESRGGGRLAPDVRREVLQSFVEERVLVLEARRRGLVPAAASPEVEQQAVHVLVAGEAARVAEVDETAVERYYAEHATEFEVPERITLRQVLVSTENEARDVRRQAERDAKNFDLLARTRSRSPEAAAGGIMGSFARGELPTDLERVAFALAPGQLSEPVKSTYGYHVLRVEERQAPRVRTLEECRGEIRTRLQRARVDETQKVFVRELLSRARVDHEVAMAGSRP